MTSFFNGDKNQLLNEMDSLSTVLNKLEEKEIKLKTMIATETDYEEIEFLEQELSVIHSQHKKGRALLASISYR